MNIRGKIVKHNVYPINKLFYFLSVVGAILFVNFNKSLNTTSYKYQIWGMEVNNEMSSCLNSLRLKTGIKEKCLNNEEF